MLSELLTPHQLAALRAGLTRPLGPDDQEQSTAFDFAYNHVVGFSQAMELGGGPEEARLAVLRDLAELAHSSQVAGLAAELERSQHVHWDQLLGLFKLAATTLHALAAGPRAEQQLRAERLGQRALLQLLRWPLVLLGPGAAALQEGARELCEHRETRVTFMLSDMCDLHRQLMRMVIQHPPALSRYMPLLSSPANRAERVRFSAAVVQVLLAMRATLGYTHPEPWLGGLRLLDVLATNTEFEGDVAGLMAQLDGGAVLAGLLLAYFGDLCSEVVVEEGGPLAPCLSDDNWVNRLIVTAVLLLSPTLSCPAKRLLATSSPQSIIHALPSGTVVEFPVPPTLTLLKLMQRTLRVLVAASPAGASGGQLVGMIQAAYQAQLFLYLCTHGALEQLASGQPDFKAGQQALRHVLDVLPAVTTWLSGLLLEHPSAATRAPLSDRFNAIVSNGFEWNATLALTVGELLAHLTQGLEQPAPVLMRAMAAGEAGVRAAARLQALLDSQPALEPLLGANISYPAATGAHLADKGAGRLPEENVLGVLPPATADRLAASAAGLAASCAKWLLLQQQREDARPGSWVTAAVAARTANQAAPVLVPLGDLGQHQHEHRVASSPLLASRNMAALLLHSLRLLQRLEAEGAGDQLTCRRHHLAALLAADEALCCPLVPQLYAQCKRVFGWEETPRQMQRMVAEGIAWEEERLLGMPAAEAGREAAQLCRARALAVRRCSNLRCTAMAGASEGEVKARRCSGCKVARFCSVACQSAAWGAHKAVCRNLAAGK